MHVYDKCHSLSSVIFYAKTTLFDMSRQTFLSSFSCYIQQSRTFHRKQLTSALNK